MPGEPWAPTLSEVARHIPTRTHDATTPGSDRMLVTFTANTTPTDAQAQGIIDGNVAGLIAETGEFPSTLPNLLDVQTAAKLQVEWQSAADIELAYPNRDADIRVAAQLQARADLAKANLLRVLAFAGIGQVDVTPEWQMLPPPPWGDSSPGSGIDFTTPNQARIF